MAVGGFSLSYTLQSLVEKCRNAMPPYPPHPQQDGCDTDESMCRLPGRSDPAGQLKLAGFH